MVSLQNNTFFYGCTKWFIHISSHFLCIDKVEKPSIFVYGDMTVGQSAGVECAVYHTCHTNPPSLTLDRPVQTSHLAHSLMPDGTTKTILRTTVKLERELQTVTCLVRYLGGQTAEATAAFRAKCM